MTGDDRLGLLAHEIRSPVAALEALASGARGVSARDLTRVANLASAAGRDLERLLSDHDVLSLRREEVELGALLDSLVEPGVTCSAESALVVCDPTRIRQALGNLVGNGLRHGTAVTVVGGRRGDRIAVVVSDDGPGVPAELDVFEKGVSGVGSSGYGLWVARAIAEAHGGTLTLASTPEKGATLTLSIPSSPPAEND